MKTFNILSTVCFTVMAVVLACAGFINPIHWVLSLMCLVMVVISIVDDSEGSSLLDDMRGGEDVEL